MLKIWPMKLFYCQINNRSVQQVVSSAGLRVICVVLHTSNVCQVVAVLLQAYNQSFKSPAIAAAIAEDNCWGRKQLSDAVFYAKKSGTLIATFSRQ